MAGLSKDSQVKSSTVKKEGGFGKRPSKGNFGKKKSLGDFGKTKGSTLKPKRSFKKSTALSKKTISKTVEKSDLLSLAQSMFNRYIRERDADLPCISCGERGNVEYHAGHFISTGAAPELRFNEWNCHKQCARCNVSLHGNQREYDKRLRKRIGEEKVGLLRLKTERLNNTVSNLMETINKYRGEYEDMRNYGDFTEEEVFAAMEAVRKKITKEGIDEVVKGGKIITHKQDVTGLRSGLEAIVSLNPEVRVDTKERTILAFHAREMLSIDF